MLGAIEVDKLTKVFGSGFVAVNNISFKVEEGEIFGLLGPNGAGKTTTIRLIITLTRPSSGSISLLGINAIRKPAEIRRQIGYVPQSVSVDGDLTAYENLLIFSKLFHVERGIRKARILEALEYMDLSERANDLVKHFSGGMMRRLEIAQSLVNRPKVLFLDEPSIGLDPNSKKQGWNYIKNLNREFGVTIFITTHDMLEADELCDRIAIMNRGNIAVMGSPNELKASVGGDVITVKFVSKPPKTSLPHELGTMIDMEDNQLKLHPFGSAEHALPRVMEFFTRANIPIDTISTSRPNLEDVFAKYTKTTLSEMEASGMYREARVARRSFQKHSG